MFYNLNQLLENLESLRKTKQFVMMKDLIGLDPEQNLHLAVLRCDVERDLTHHLQFAKKVAGLGIVATFYFHSRRECYDPRVFEVFQNMGHEVGFHHECLDRCRGDFESAKLLFKREVKRFSDDGYFPVTVCAHGESGLFKSGYRFNYELFDHFPELLSQCGISGEVYHEIIPKWKPVYVSDVFSSYWYFWQKFEMGRSKPELIHLLIHPHRWHSNPLISAFEVGKDLSQALQNKAFKYRKYNAIVV